MNGRWKLHVIQLHVKGMLQLLVDYKALLGNKVLTDAHFAFEFICFGRIRQKLVDMIFANGIATNQSDRINQKITAKITVEDTFDLVDFKHSCLK